MNRDLGLLFVLFGITVMVARSPAPPPAATRIAIRAQCGPACDFAESLSLDVWSEERGPGLPLDLVVTPSALPLLDAAGVTWDVLVPDTDADARAEHVRLQRPPPADFFGEFHDYSAISEHLRGLAALAPERAS
ncbi:MAG: hypothetical protein ABI678_31570, partial [Kofleriaceae bacterium]